MPALQLAGVAVGSFYFGPNQGQPASGVRFVARTPGAVVLIGDRSIDLRGPDLHSKLSIGFERAEAQTCWQVPAHAAGSTSYIRGSQRANWLSDIPHFAGLTCRNLYPGIDLVLYGAAGRLEYDLVVAPGANPASIAIRVTGAGQSSLNARDDLMEGSFPLRPDVDNPTAFVRANSAGIATLTIQQPAGFTAPASGASMTIAVR